MSWRCGDDGVSLDVTIPPGSAAEVVLPVGDAFGTAATESGAPVWSDGAFVAGVDGVYAGSAQADGSVMLEIGSGTYSFTVA